MLRFKPLHCSCGCNLRFTVLLEGEFLPVSKRTDVRHTVETMEYGLRLLSHLWSVVSQMAGFDWYEPIYLDGLSAVCKFIFPLVPFSISRLAWLGQGCQPTVAISYLKTRCRQDLGNLSCAYFFVHACLHPASCIFSCWFKSINRWGELTLLYFAARLKVMACWVNTRGKTNSCHLGKMWTCTAIRAALLF